LVRPCVPGGARRRGRSRVVEESVFPLCRFRGQKVQLADCTRPADGRHALRGDAIVSVSAAPSGSNRPMQRRQPRGLPERYALCRVSGLGSGERPPSASRRVASPRPAQCVTARDRLPVSDRGQPPGAASTWDAASCAASAGPGNGPTHRPRPAGWPKRPLAWGTAHHRPGSAVAPEERGPQDEPPRPFGDIGDPPRAELLSILTGASQPMQ